MDSTDTEFADLTWVEYRNAETGKVVEVARVDGWLIQDGMETRFADPDGFEERYVIASGGD